jgi:gliding motility-associated-like protein
MKPLLTKLFLIFALISGSYAVSAQLIVTPNTTALELAQKLVGDGVTISNVSFTGRPEMAAFFLNRSNTNIVIDSGIVLTSGRAKTVGTSRGVDGDGATTASSSLADNGWSLPGDGDLATAIGTPLNELEDACILEFDFVPLGDSIKFRYVFSSEEYTPAFVCSFNDAFAFFISGPGIPGLKNIALVPNTNIPVSIFNVNDVPGGACPNNQPYYIDNRPNLRFTHDGHTVVLTAKEQVQPCQTYHLKIVISDVGDDLYDSGVFLEARSLTSAAIGMTNLTQIDPVTGLSYLVEGCATGAFNVRRPRKDPYPLVVNFSFGGTAINGVDYQPMPTSVVIPANDSFVTVNVIPLMDGIPEGIEEIKIYALAGCTAATVPTDSTVIQVRDYDILSMTPADTATICKNASIQLVATTGYTVYQWVADPTLSNINIRDPLATPVSNGTTYICTATVGTCNARDSVFIQWKDLEFVSRTDVNCRNGNNGQIKVSGGPEWEAPREFSLDGINWQTDSTFNNLPVGTYWVKMRDGACIDSVQVTIAQAYPDFLITGLAKTDASCSGAADGTVTVTATGGNAPYTYSIDGTNFQASNLFNLAGGNYTVTIKDANGCLDSQPVTVALNNTVTVEAGADETICEGKSFLIPAVSNAVTFSWTPAATLDNGTILTPTASPTTTTKYYLTATDGICSKIDSVTVIVRPAPIADAGTDISICYGKTYQLHGAGGVSFEWSPSTHFISATNVKDPDVKASSDIIYSLMVTDGFGCRSLSPDAVEVNVTPSVRIFAGNDTIAAMGQPLQLNVREMSLAGVTSYSWTPAIDLTGANSATPIATLQRDQRFIVVGTTPDGCQGIDDIMVKVYKGPEIYVPSGFTPNNDGLNDVLRPIAVGIKEFRFFQVFNRWGQLIYSSKDPQRGWDGRVNGTEQGTGTFVWMAEAVDYRGNLITRKGVVTIIR